MKLRKEFDSIGSVNVPVINIGVHQLKDLINFLILEKS